MDTEISAHSALAYTAWILVQLLNAPHAFYLPPPYEEEDEDNNPLLAFVDDL